MKWFYTQPTYRQLAAREAQARREKQIRDIKDFFGIPYMGKGE